MEFQENRPQSTIFVETPTEIKKEKEVIKNEPSTALKVGVLLALIALLIVGILLPIKLVPDAFGSFGSKFSGLFTQSTKIALSADKNPAHINEPFTLTWNGDHRSDGTYILSYTCSNNVGFTTSVNQPNEAIACGSQYYFVPQKNSIVLVPTGKDTQGADISLGLSFLQTGSTTPVDVGSLAITVVNPTASNPITNPATSTPPVVSPTPIITPTQQPVVTTPSPTPVTPAPVTPAPTPKPTPGVSNPNGIADLSVRVIAVGYIDPGTGAFVESQSAAPNSRVAVKFNVMNAGTKSTGAWSFTATLPSAAHPVFYSPIERSLTPQSGSIFTLSFDYPQYQGINTISIQLDPNHSVSQSNRSNDYATASITRY